MTLPPLLLQLLRRLSMPPSGSIRMMLLSGMPSLRRRRIVQFQRACLMLYMVVHNSSGMPKCSIGMCQIVTR